MIISGACHCGNITFRLDWRPAPVEIPARACTCSFCLKHGNVWTSCATGALTVRIGDAEHVSRYAFGTRTAEFYVCTVCGVVPVVTSNIDGNLYAVVNVNALEGVEPHLIRRIAASFDGDTDPRRLARRKRDWIPRVEIVGGAAIRLQ